MYFCGYASRDSYGAASWLVTRPDGNVLIDSPRAASVLMDRVAELGDLPSFACGGCGAVDVEVVSGEEFLITSLEVVQEEAST